MDGDAQSNNLRFIFLPLFFLRYDSELQGSWIVQETSVIDNRKLPI
jgi:hypothetical protein